MALDSRIMSEVVRVYKGSGDRPGTPIRGQVIDRSLHKGSGDNPVTPAAAAAGDLSMMTVYTLYYYYYSITEMKIKNNFYTKLYCFFHLCTMW